MRYVKKRTRPMLSDKETVNRLGDETMQTILDNKAIVKEVAKGDNPDAEEAAYSMPKFLRLFRGYDFLQNILFVNQYIMKKYKLSHIHVLYSMLYLYPINIFTPKDFNGIKNIRFTFSRLKVYEDIGMIEKLYYDPKIKRSLYRLSHKGKKMVEEYYELLACEKKFNEDILDKTNIQRDKAMNKIIKKLNQKEPSENMKKFWRKHK